MGHIISQGCRKPSPDKVTAILDHPLPDTVTDVRSMLGIANYLGEYIPNLADITAPFQPIRSGAKNAKVKLNEEQIEAWAKVKRILATTPILQLPNFEKKFVLATDASEFAIGCVLLQPDIGKLLPVEYYSRTLKSAELNYAIYDKELLGMQEGMRKFRVYLQGAPFILLTDHKPLEHFRSSKKNST
jgi:hypothetical protein